jgi:orotidine-5'-phosphate decarboxylase
MKPSERIIVALDTIDVERAVSMAATLAGFVGGLKLGKEFFTANGPGAVGRISQFGLPLFLDLKFHDIPNTVAAAVRAALPLRPHMINVHATGGSAMMQAAVAAAAEAGKDRPLVLGVTVLTSLAGPDLASIGVFGAVRDQVLRLALMAKDCGLDGVVCSAEEVVTLRGACGHDFKLVVPGIRPLWSTKDDHKRVLTPSDAVSLGADYLVIGRPITGADDPAGAARRIGEEIAGLTVGA